MVTSSPATSVSDCSVRRKAGERRPEPIASRSDRGESEAPLLVRNKGGEDAIATFRHDRDRDTRQHDGAGPGRCHAANGRNARERLLVSERG